MGVAGSKFYGLSAIWLSSRSKTGSWQTVRNSRTVKQYDMFLVWLSTSSLADWLVQSFGLAPGASVRVSFRNYDTNRFNRVDGADFTAAFLEFKRPMRLTSEKWGHAVEVKLQGNDNAYRFLVACSACGILAGKALPPGARTLKKPLQWQP